jgi:lysophospholipase L1-like esterase
VPKLSRPVQVIATGVLVLVVLAGLAVGITRYNDAVADDVAQGERAQQGYKVPTADDRRSAETRVTVLGDSYAGGSAMNSGPTWPTQLAEQNGWTLDLEAVGGTGFVNKSTLGLPLSGRLDKVPRKYTDLVIFALGGNDTELNLTDVKKAAKKAIDDVRAITPASDFVILSPFLNGTDKRRPAVTNLRDALADIAKAEGIPYIDVTGFLPPSAIGEDGTHPTDAGHAILTQKIGAALKALDLPKADAWKAA